LPRIFTINENQRRTHHRGTEKILIKWVQITALVRSPEEFDPLVKLLELLGLRKGPVGENENCRSVEFVPSRLLFDVIQRKRPWDDVELGLMVSDLDTALGLVKRHRYDIVEEGSGPEPEHLIGNFRIKLPGGTLVMVWGPRVVDNVADTDHLALEGDLRATGKHFAIVVSRFNSFIVERLLAAAIDCLVRCGAKLGEDIEIVRVPGAFEIPLAARKLAETKKYDAIICLGCLLRGDTAHYDVIVNEVTRGIGQSAQETGIPHSFGVLTCDTLEQAIDRAGLKMGNKGAEAALAAIEMANLAKFVRTTLFRRQASVVRKSGVKRRSSAIGEKQIPRSARNDKTRKRNDKSTTQSAKTKRE
jgi:6,7-dimethyl-8-ribityllumazine synthase